MSTTDNTPQSEITIQPQSLMGVWLLISGEMVLFGSLFASYFAFRFQHPQSFLEASRALNNGYGFFGTVIIIVCAFIMALAYLSSKKGEEAPIKKYLTISSLLGLVFIVLKLIECFSSGKSGDLKGENASFFVTHLHLITTVFVVHLGLAILFNVIFILRGKSYDSYLSKVQALSLFWQMGALVWVLAYPLLYSI